MKWLPRDYSRTRGKWEILCDEHLVVDPVNGLQRVEHPIEHAWLMLQEKSRGDKLEELIVLNGDMAGVFARCDTCEQIVSKSEHEAACAACLSKFPCNRWCDPNEDERYDCMAKAHPYFVPAAELCEDCIVVCRKCDAPFCGDVRCIVKQDDGSGQSICTDCLASSDSVAIHFDRASSPGSVQYPKRERQEEEPSA